MGVQVAHKLWAPRYFYIESIDSRELKYIDTFIHTFSYVLATCALYMGPCSGELFLRAAKIFVYGFCPTYFCIDFPPSHTTSTVVVINIWCCHFFVVALASSLGRPLYPRIPFHFEDHESQSQPTPAVLPSSCIRNENSRRSVVLYSICYIPRRSRSHQLTVGRGK